MKIHWRTAALQAGLAASLCHAAPVPDCRRLFDDIRHEFNRFHVNEESRRYLAQLIAAAEQVVCDPVSPAVVRLQFLEALKAKLALLRAEQIVRDVSVLQRAGQAVGATSLAAMKADGPPATQPRGAPAPPGQCSVEILAAYRRRNQAVFIPKRTGLLSPGQQYFMHAEGRPGGGAYRWRVEGGDSAFLPSSDADAVFWSDQEGTFLVTVQYTDPAGRMCEAKIEIFVDE